MAKQNLRDLAKKVEKSIPKISTLVANAEVLGTTTALGDITRRIFNEGKLTNGGNIGNYTSPPYKSRRQKKGLQVAYVDLQFTGDLFNSITIGKFNDKPAVGIKSEKENDVAEHLEKRYGQIFVASDDEKKIALETARDYMFKGIKDIVKSWS